MIVLRDKIEFVVVDENILGYIDPMQPWAVGILHASPLRGATRNNMGGYFLRPLGDIGVRLATQKDFNIYRVCGDGYKRNTERYNFPVL